MGVIKDIKAAIDHIKQHVPILSVVSKEVEMQQAGPDLHKGVCCFHDEDTPSLTVSPSKHMFYCFGCKEGGDVVTFLQKKSNMGVTEAIRHLSQTYSVDIAQFERDLTPEEQELHSLSVVNKNTAAHLKSILLEGNNRGYHYMVNERGISPEMLEEFGIGYSRSIADSMACAGATDRISVALELDKPAMWTDAVIYPLHDPHGKVIGFKTRPYWGGRLVDDRGHKYAKFLGTSSKSPLHSDKHVYGMHIARKHVDRGQLIGVEGQHDVIKMHQHGIRNTIGTDGTTFNKEKAALLEEYGITSFVVLFDGDAAGRDAALKIAREVVGLETTIAIKIAVMPDGYDPDEFLTAYGPVAIRNIISQAVYATQHLVDHMASEVGLETVTQRIDFIRRVQPVVFKASAVEQAFLLSYVAEKAKIPTSVMDDMIREDKARGAKSLLYNTAGEKAVLGGMMRDEEFRSEVLSDMRKDDWYLPRHQELFAMIVDMVNADVPIGVDTLKISMNNRGLNQLMSEGQVIDEIFATVGDHYTILDDLIDKSSRRKIIKASEDLRLNAQDLKTKLAVVTEGHMDTLQSAVSGVAGSNMLEAQDGASDFMNTLHTRMRNPGQIIGVDMGANWRNLTKLLSGLQKKALITIAANQSVGKTTLLSNFLDEISVTQRRPWAHFSLEMPNEQVVSKIIGLRAGVDSSRMQVGDLTDEEYRRVQMAAAEYYSGKLIIDDEARSLEQIIAASRKLIKTHGVEGISIDYVQLMTMESKRHAKKYEAEGDISGGLKNDLAKKLNLPVVILSQLSRGAKDKDTPTAEDGAGAYKISQDSDVYMILFEKKQDEIEQFGIEKGNMSLFVDKNRLGPADRMIDVLFERETQRMMEIR
jgi:DNA primase catalytic core